MPRRLGGFASDNDRAQSEAWNEKGIRPTPDYCDRSVCVPLADLKCKSVEGFDDLRQENCPHDKRFFRARAEQREREEAKRLKGFKEQRKYWR
jgi:hypothetical protein